MNANAFTLIPSLSLTAFVLALAGCNEHPVKPIEIDGSSTPVQSLPLDVNKKVDVLLVIDNSGSMAEEQANLAANFGPFIERLEAAGADYRIAITTTDIGGPDCGPEPTAGLFQASSCADRPDDFGGAANPMFASACTDQCGFGDAELERRATLVAGSDEAEVRPWIQSANGVSNLPDGVAAMEAFSCLAPQGVTGCGGFESPLEAITRSLDNMQNENAPEHGFLRDDALLAVLVLTDETDCGYSPGMADELVAEMTFWDPDGPDWATSAVCWNAGVECVGNGSPYDGCFTADYDADGELTEDPSEAVLRPVSSYIERLAAVAESKVAGREVFVSLIAGVPEGYPAQPIVFQNDLDPDHQGKFGIAPGCTSTVDGVEQMAIPPMRMLEVAEAFAVEGGGVYSVCSADYTPAIEDIVEGLTVELPPACYGGCVRDSDPSTDELDYTCEVRQEVGFDEEQVPECVDGGLPEGADACWILHSGAAIDPACDLPGRNAEFELIRRVGVEVPEGANVVASCEVSLHPSIDCG